MTERTYIATCKHGWGKGDHETEAFGFMMEHVPDHTGEDLEVSLFEAINFRELEFGMFSMSIDADEVTEEEFVIDSRTVDKIYELQSDLEILLEEALYE